MADLEKLAAGLGRLPQLTVSGGEPLLRKDLPQILETFYRSARTRFFTVPTNALLPDRVLHLIDYFVANCSDGYLNLCLPFHGDEGQFEEILGVRGAYPKFCETYAAIQDRRESHSNVSCLLNFVMTRYNCHSFETIIDRARLQFPETPLGISLCRGNTHEPDAGDVPPEIYDAAQRYLAASARPWSGFNPYSLMYDTICSHIGILVSEVATGERKNLGCGAGRQLLVVYDDGSVFPCEMIDVIRIPEATPGVLADGSLGNLHDYDFDVRRLLEALRAKKTVDWIASHDCACTWESAIYAKIVHSPASLVRLGGSVVKRIGLAEGSFLAPRKR